MIPQENSWDTSGIGVNNKIVLSLRKTTLACLLFGLVEV